MEDDELKFMCHTLPDDLNSSKIQDPITFLEALKAVDLELVKLILDQVELDHNATYCYDQTKTNLKRRGWHLVQSFGFAQRVASICYLFEKTDEWKNEDFKNAKVILELILKRGMVLENAIFDSKDQRYCENRSNYFWLTVFRKLYMLASDNPNTPGLSELISWLEEALHKNSENYGLIPRSAQLYLGVEQQNHELVKKVLYESKPLMSHTLSGPWDIFPFGCAYHFPIKVSPLVIALKNVDVKMINILNRCPTFKQDDVLWLFDDPQRDFYTYRRNNSRVVALFLGILEKDEHFFDKEDLQLDLSKLTISPTSRHQSNCGATLVKIAKIFLCTKLNRSIGELRNLAPAHAEEKDHLQNTYTPGDPIIKILLRDDPIQKSVTMLALENKNYDMVKLFRSWGLDINDLGETSIQSRLDESKGIRNRFNLWYIIIKYLLTAPHFSKEGSLPLLQPAVILHKMSKFPEFIEGPAIVGSIFEAMKGPEHDMEFLKKVKTFFPGWFNVKFKTVDSTAHELLIKYKLNEGASLLMSYLGPNSQKKMDRHEFMVEMDKVDKYEDFVAYIDSNQYLLHQSYSGGLTFLHMMVDNAPFSAEKFKYLIQSGADPSEENSHRENIVDFILKISCRSIEPAQKLVTILSLQSECEEIQILISRSTHLIYNFCEQIFLAKTEEIRGTLVSAFGLLINSPVFNLELLLFPERISLREKPVHGVFHSIRESEELLKLVTTVCVKLILKDSHKNSEEKDDTKIENFIMVLKSYCQTGGTRIESLFHDMKELLDMQDPQHPLSSWRDKYDMTLLMRLVLFSHDENYSAGGRIDPLLCYIITAGLFDDQYLGYQVKNEMAIRFQQSHLHEKVKDSKIKNDVIEKDKLYAAKRIKRVNPETGQLEDIVGKRQMPGQVKIMGTFNIKQEDGTFLPKRTILTATKNQPQTIIEDPEDDILHPESQDCDEDEELSDFDSSERDSVAIDVSDIDSDLDEEDVAGQEESGLPVQSMEYLMIGSSNPNEEENKRDKDKTKELEIYRRDVLKVKGKLMTPEHFNTASVKSISGETFVTEKNKYKVAPSASTRFIETMDVGEGPSSLYSNHLTLTLLVCKAQKWRVLSSILNLDPGDFPITLKSTAEKKGKHPLLLTDEMGFKCLDLILDSGQLDLIKKMFKLIDEMRLKSQLQDILPRLKNLCESEDDEYVDILIMVLNKTAQKYDKSNLGALISSHYDLEVIGTSCGYTFKPVNGLSSWKCLNCNISVTSDEESKLEDNNHYTRHECKVKMPKVFNNVGELQLDKLRFQFTREDGDSSSEEEEEELSKAVKGDWRCIKRKCEAKINVLDDCIDASSTSEFCHTCKPCLKMEVKAFLEQVQFNLISSDKGFKWKCQNCSLEIETSEDFKLREFYRKSKHTCQ